MMNALKTTTIVCDFRYDHNHDHHNSSGNRDDADKNHDLDHHAHPASKSAIPRGLSGMID